ncbi:MAG: diguanylate cyclase [Pseudomonadota bacterium]
MPNKLDIEEFLPLFLGAAAALGVLPFAVIRLLNGDWAIGLLDSAIVIALAGLCVYIYRTRRFRAAGLAVALICTAGMLITVYLKGPVQIYWAYPAMMAVFFLVRPTHAIVINGLGLFGIMPALAAMNDPLLLATVSITLLVTITFAYAFAAITRGQRNELLRLANRDPLTGAGNRRAFQQKLTSLVAERKRSQAQASMVMLDLDHFKALNDAYGHDVGDRILVRVAELISLRIRASDSFFRIGGEEFVILTEGEGLSVAARLAEQLRALVAECELIPSGQVTISLGVAELKPHESHDEWLKRADEALYAAKRSGRNKTSLAAAAA